MSYFYRELHDRELLSQAELILQELQDRALIDVFLPPSDVGEQERTLDTVFPRRLTSISVENGKLALSVERRFFQE